MFQACRGQCGGIPVTGLGAGPKRAGRGGVFAVLLLAGLCMMTAPAQADPPPEGQGDFRVQNYATGTGNGNYVYRGYLFKPARDVVVTGMWGGFGPNCSEFGGAIYNATLTGGGTVTVPEFNIGSIVREVRFTDGIANTPEFRPFLTNITSGDPDPATLSADNYYVIAQGRIVGGSGCHFNSGSLDFENLLLGSAIIDEWYPQQDAQYNISGTGEPSINVGKTISWTDTIRILVGFRYETDVAQADLSGVSTTAFQLDGTNNVVVNGLLSDSGLQSNDQELTLYFEWSTSSDFSGSTLTPAEPFTITGPAQDVPFGVTLSGLANGTTYHVRAVAISEAGRVDANALSFTVGSMDEGFEVQATASLGGSVTPATRAVESGNTTTFFAQPSQYFTPLEDVGGTCPQGSWDGNTYTTGEITEACNVEINFASHGSCGPATETNSLMAPTAGLCANGTASAVLSADGVHSWTCDGTGGGETAMCSTSGQDGSPAGPGVGDDSGTVTLTSTGPECVVNQAEVVSPPPELPQGYNMPFGLVDFTVSGCSGGAVTIQTTYSGSVEGMVYWKYINDDWVVMPADISGNTITFTVEDNGPFDADPAEGVIRDPSGPGLPLSGPGSGVTSIPTLSQWGLFLMTGLLALMALWGLRRRQPV